MTHTQHPSPTAPSPRDCSSRCCGAPNGMLSREDLERAGVTVKTESCHCGGRLQPALVAPFYVRWPDGTRRTLPSLLRYCARCDLFIRDLDYAHPIVATHFDIASYTDPASEDRWRRRRVPFFEWLCDLGKTALGAQPEVVVDYGCGYGHLLDMLSEEGATTIGIEVAPHMLTRLRSRGRHRVFRCLSESDVSDQSADMIFAIDSYYLCSGDPAALMGSFARKLRPGGVLILRTTNRRRWRVPAPGVGVHRQR